MASKKLWENVLPSEFASPKVRRKLRSDGAVDTATSAAELFVRKRLGRRVLDPLVDSGIVRVLPRKAVRERATETVDIFDEGEQEPPRFVSRFDSGYVLTETGLATTASFEILEESADAPDHAQQAMMAMCSRELFFGRLPTSRLLGIRSSTDAPVLDTVAPLIPRYPKNYYHWMVETVPKVRYLREFERQTGTEVTVLIPSNPLDFVTETLELLGWPDDRVRQAADPMYQVRNLVVPSYPERTREDFDWLRETILGSVSPDNTSGAENSDKNVYVSRTNAVSRRVVNEAEVVDVLEEYGFERYVLEERSVAENARLFDNANIVVGPHGAGLTDVIFADGCALVELFGARLNRAYENLSESLGVSYHPMYCEDDSADIVVDTDKLAEKIATLQTNSRDE